MKVRQRLGEILSKIELRGEEFIIERAGRPSAVLMPYRKIQRIRERAAREFKESFKKAAETNPNADLSDEEVERFVNQVIHETRSQK